MMTIHQTLIADAIDIGDILLGDLTTDGVAAMLVLLDRLQENVLAGSAMLATVPG